MSLFSELKRRNVIRVAIAYLASSWLLITVADTVFPAFGLPDWGLNLLMIACALGFLPALVVSWIYVLTPEGLVRDEPIARSSASRLDITTIFLFMAVLAFITIEYFFLDAGPQKQILTPAGTVDEAAYPQAHYPSNSIAVLPFVNMSDDTSNEYFSDGISEELIHLLARVRGLSVISRSSAFFFKGKEFNIPTVAEKLNVAHVLEGSVRKSGNRIRITVQLIDTRSDIHLWSKTYDRKLDDILVVQGEIADMVVGQLKLTLLGELPTVKQINTEAYTLYLQARYVGREYSAHGFERSNVLYEQALAIDPDYAAARSGLATNYTNQVANGLLPLEEGISLARASATKALESDPNYAPAHANLGWLAYGYDNDVTQAARHYERALELDPVNTYIIRSAATLLNSINRVDEAISLGEYFTAHDPATASGHTNLGSSYLRAGRWNEAIASYQTSLQLSPDYIGAHYRIGVALLLKGDAAAALETFSREIDEEYRVKGSALALYALGREEEFQAGLAELVNRWGDNWPSEVAHVFAYIGDADSAFQWLDKAVRQKEEGLIEQVFYPLYQGLHADQRWELFLKNLGCSSEQLNAIEFRVTLPYGSVKPGK